MWSPVTRVLVGLGGAAALAALVLAVLVASRFPEAALWVLPIDAFYLAGLWAARRHPDGRAAHRLLWCGLISASWLALGLLLLLSYDDAGATGGVRVLNAVVLGLDIALPASVLALLATFPRGPARGLVTRLALGVGWLLVALVPLASLVSGPGQVPAYVLVWNLELETLPAGLVADAALRELTVAAHEMALALLPLAGAVLLLAAYRRAAATDRRRIRWLALAGLVIAIDGVFTGVPAINVIPTAVSIPLIGSLPVLAAIGIARPDAFDIDEALRRAAQFAVLWIASSLVYVALASATGVAASSTLGGGAAAVPVAVAATIAFYPLWQRVLRAISTALLGSRLDADELLRRVGSALEHTLDPAALAAPLADIIKQGLGASWVRIEIDDRLVATSGKPPDDGQPAIETALEHGDAVIGRIECGPRRGGREFLESDRRRLELLGRQLALAAHNARLAADLNASRARLVEAEERGRRRIQRDIHDGIQQDIVAILAHLALAEEHARRRPEAVAGDIAGLRSEAGRALTALRDLASGIHPSVLADRGIVEAIEARASGLPIGVTIVGGDVLRGVRCDALVESAVYFTVSEALTNAIKHSGSTGAQVDLRIDGGHLSVAIDDRGSGFDPAATPSSGLAGLADRIHALGGTFAVDSTPGAGTSVRARLPLALEPASA